jgi:hypothetical protein
LARGSPAISRGTILLAWGGKLVRCLDLHKLSDSALLSGPDPAFVAVEPHEVENGGFESFVFIVVAARQAVLSVITGGGKWVEIIANADPLYQHLIVTAERKFWRCVESGEPPSLFGVDPPKPRMEVVRIVDMSTSNAWAEFAAVFARTKAAHAEHEVAKVELKGLMPEDAKEAIGHGVRGRRSKSGAVSFDLLTESNGEGNRHAPIQ